jgi:acyl-CoA synthetase (AMP-forming)/AMP-acid ligase II
VQFFNTEFLFQNSYKVIMYNYVFFIMKCLFYSCFGPSHCLQIAHFKIPRHVLFLVDFPKTVSGKIQKFKLQKMVLEEGYLGTG